jgi:cell volume regulation protein A
MDIEIWFVSLSILLIISILIYTFTKNWGIPSFLIFIGFGLFFGDGRFDEPVFDNPQLTQELSSIALNIIIFVGGFQSKISDIKSSYREGIVLSTIGVLLTTLILGFFTFWFSNLSLMAAILFGAIVSSTDAAVVFGILEAKKINLRYRTGTILQFESATNDPMALILVMLFANAAMDSTGTSFNYFASVLFFLKLLGIGAIFGLVFGKLTQWLLRAVRFKDPALVPVFILGFFFIATYLADWAGGNLLITSYLFGVIVGNTNFQFKKNSLYFNESLSWLSQSLMFLLLGLQIFLYKLGDYALVSIFPALFLIFIARPLAVLISLLPFRKEPFSKKIFISAIGLKGATPIVFAFIPLQLGVPEGEQIFYMVFYAVMASIFIQGTALSPLSKRLSLGE